MKLAQSSKLLFAKAKALAQKSLIPLVLTPVVSSYMEHSNFYFIILVAFEYFI